MTQHLGIEITTLDRMDGDVIIVGFSDGTLGTYSVEELLELRPDRRPASEESGSDGSRS